MIKLANGAQPLRIAGTIDEGIVLAEWNNEYVTWHYCRPTADSYSKEGYGCQWGNYFRFEFANGPSMTRAWDDAVKDFHKRVNLFFGGNS